MSIFIATCAAHRLALSDVWNYLCNGLLVKKYSKIVNQKVSQ